MKYLWWFVIPIHLVSAQTDCVISHSTVTIHDTRPLFMSKTEFEQKLLTTARTRLIQQESPIQVDHQVVVTQSGINTSVTTHTRQAVTNHGQGTITSECYRIQYRTSREAYIVLSGQVTPILTPTTITVTPPTSNPITREEWIQFTPFALLYLIIFLV